MAFRPLRGVVVTEEDNHRHNIMTYINGHGECGQCGWAALEDGHCVQCDVLVAERPTFIQRIYRETEALLKVIQDLESQVESLKEEVKRLDGVKQNRDMRIYP